MDKIILGCTFSMDNYRFCISTEPHIHFLKTHHILFFHLASPMKSFVFLFFTLHYLHVGDYKVGFVLAENVKSCKARCGCCWSTWWTDVDVPSNTYLLYLHTSSKCPTIRARIFSFFFPCFFGRYFLPCILERCCFASERTYAGCCCVIMRQNASTVNVVTSYTWRKNCILLFWRRLRRVWLGIFLLTMKLKYHWFI